MNITEAGKQTSLTPNTLRYYERIGLIPPGNTLPKTSAG